MQDWGLLAGAAETKVRRASVLSLFRYEADGTGCLSGLASEVSLFGSVNDRSVLLSGCLSVAKDPRKAVLAT